MMRVLSILLVLGLAACGADGEPTYPGETAVAATPAN